MACWAAWLHTNQMAPPCISSSRRSVKRHTMPRRTTQCVLKCCVHHQRHLGEEEEQPLLGGGCDRHTRVDVCQPFTRSPFQRKAHKLAVSCKIWKLCAALSTIITREIIVIITIIFATVHQRASAAGCFTAAHSVCARPVAVLRAGKAFVVP